MLSRASKDAANGRSHPAAEPRALSRGAGAPRAASPNPDRRLPNAIPDAPRRPDEIDALAVTSPHGRKGHLATMGLWVDELHGRRDQLRPHAVRHGRRDRLISQVYHPKQDGLVPIFAMLFGSAALGATFCGILVWRNRRGGKGI
jgi:hypothetical protein